MKNLLIMLAGIVLTCLMSIHAVATEPCISFYEREIRGKAALEVQAIHAKLKNEKSRPGCILGNADTTGIKGQYQKLLAKPAGEDLAIERGLLLEMMLNEFEDVPTEECEGLASKGVACRHLRALLSLDTQVRGGTFDLIENPRNDWVPDNYSSKIAISNVNVADFLDEQCGEDIDELVCADAVALSAKLLRTSLAANELITSYQQPVIGVNDRFLSGRDKEWEAYLNGASVQFPWELAFNSWRFSKKTDDKDKFPRAPTSRWVLFHPSPAVEVIDSPVDGDSTEATILMEVFGYQLWRWRDGQQGNRWGASGIISVADINGMDTFGYGVLLHTPIKNAALGVIWRDGENGGEIGVVLNMDLVKLLKNYGNDDLMSFLNR